MTSSAPSAIPSTPGEFACIDLVNSALTQYLGKGPGFDRLPLPEWQAWFLNRYGLGVDTEYPAPIDELTALREQLRTTLERWAMAGSLTARDAEALDRWVSTTPLRQRVTKISGRIELTLEPLTRDWNWAMGRIAASVLEMVAGNAPERLKICGNPDCRRMFYDQTLNRSKRFCSASRCGNVMRVRRFRAKQPRVAGELRCRGCGRRGGM